METGARLRAGTQYGQEPPAVAVVVDRLRALCLCRALQYSPRGISEVCVCSWGLEE